jgi:hypothetical protein
VRPSVAILAVVSLGIPACGGAGFFDVVLDSSVLSDTWSCDGPREDANTQQSLVGTADLGSGGYVVADTLATGTGEYNWDVTALSEGDGFYVDCSVFSEDGWSSSRQVNLGAFVSGDGFEVEQVLVSAKNIDDLLSGVIQEQVSVMGDPGLAELALTEDGRFLRGSFQDHDAACSGSEEGPVVELAPCDVQIHFEVLAQRK